MLGLMGSAWWNFEGGSHPCFLFLAMLFVFQCGRLPGYMTGFPEDPFLIGGQQPFSVSRLSEDITLLLIAVSAVCVYIPCRFSYRRVVFSVGPEQSWLSALYLLLAVTLPFALYKNYLYLSYVRNHGGYLAIYTDREALLQSAGFLVRAVGLIGTSVLLLLYLFERRRGCMTMVLTLFFAVSAMDLMIGLRGKFFIQILVLWFIRNLKTGKKFNLIPLIFAAAIISVLAVAIAGFREERAVELLSPVGFVSNQGISMLVTELAVEKHLLFEKNGEHYLLGELKSAFIPGTVITTGDSFDGDLSLYLDPVAFKAGYSLGSSYLAEAYLFGGIFVVVVASLLIGTILSWLHNQSSSWIGAVLMMASLGTIIYMPRSGLIDPLPMTLKSLLAMGVAGAVILSIKALLQLFQKSNFGITPNAKFLISWKHKQTTSLE